jgi:ankyrin repeat protein
VLICSNLEEGLVEACVKLLFHLGANVIPYEYYDDRTLEAAACRGKTGALRALVASHKFPPPLLDRAVNHVARYGIYGDAVRTLVDGGADPNAVDGDGMTPIMCAAQSGNSSVFAALVERGADIYAVCTKEVSYKKAGPKDYRWEGWAGFAWDIGWTVTMWAVEGRNPSVVTALAAQGADLNKADIGGMTPTLLAIKLKRYEAFEALVNGGADLNKADNEGTTPTILAIIRQDRKAFNALVNGGADINLADKEGKTPLMWASEPPHSLVWNARIIVGMLVSAGAEVDSVDNYGKSALMWAALTGASNAVVAALIRHGANLNLASHNGETATDLASRLGHSEIAGALRGAGAIVPGPGRSLRARPAPPGRRPDA